jgi:hypothetical protein
MIEAQGSMALAPEQVATCNYSKENYVSASATPGKQSQA